MCQAESQLFFRIKIFSRKNSNIFSILKPFLQFNIGRYTRFFRSIVIPWVTYAHRSNNLIFANICLSSSSGKSKRIAFKVIPILLRIFFRLFLAWSKLNITLPISRSTLSKLRCRSWLICASHKFFPIRNKFHDRHFPFWGSCSHHRLIEGF